MSIDELEDMVAALKDYGVTCYRIYKRSLPPRKEFNKVVAFNLPSVADAMILIKARKLIPNEVVIDGVTHIVYYDVLPDNISSDDIFYNDAKRTTVGNAKKKVAERYFGMDEE